MKKYLVGGAVRDSLLKLPIKEKDWVVIGATPKDMIANGYLQVGKDFPVFLHPKNHEEYALARTERKFGYGYIGFICNSSPTITLQEDLFRRDLTINAIAKDENNNIIDPYNGIKDINYRRLRHVSSAFKEDPLRVLRTARFAARFAHLNFYIVPETMQLMHEMTNELTFLPPERVWRETFLALKTENPQIYFEILHNCGALKILLPEIDSLFNIPYYKNIKMKINTGTHTMMALLTVTKLSKDIGVRFATLCHDLGKIKTLPKKHYNHEKIGINIVENLCKRLKIPHLICKLAKISIKYHNLLNNANKLTAKMIIKLFNDIDIWRHPSRLEQIILVSEANIKYNFLIENIKKKYTPRNFLNSAYFITNSVTLNNLNKKKIINGAEYKYKLYLKRKNILNKWKKFLKKIT